MAQALSTTHPPVSLNLNGKGVSRLQTEKVGIEVTSHAAAGTNGLSWSLSHFVSRGPDEVEVISKRPADYVFTQVPLSGTFDAELTCGTTFCAGSAGLIRPKESSALFRFNQRESRLFGVLIPLTAVEGWFGAKVTSGARELLNNTRKGSFHRPYPLPGFLCQMLTSALQNQSPMRHNLIDGAALHILNYQLENLDTSDARSPSLFDQHRARDAQALMKVNAASPLSTSDLAARLQISPRRLDIAHREVFGCSLHQAMMQLRLQAACDALLQGESIKLVAHRMGYANSSNFSYAFRRQMGLPPRAWLDAQSGRTRDHQCCKVRLLSRHPIC